MHWFFLLVLSVIVFIIGLAIADKNASVGIPTLLVGVIFALISIHAATTLESHVFLRVNMK